MRRVAERCVKVLREIKLVVFGSFVGIGTTNDANLQAQTSMTVNLEPF